jgi:hypothetical protein
MKPTKEQLEKRRQAQELIEPLLPHYGGKIGKLAIAAGEPEARLRGIRRGQGIVRDNEMAALQRLAARLPEEDASAIMPPAVPLVTHQQAGEMLRDAIAQVRMAYAELVGMPPSRVIVSIADLGA